MTLGELFLEAMSTGVITNGEMAWVTAPKINSHELRRLSPNGWAV